MRELAGFPNLLDRFLEKFVTKTDINISSKIIRLIPRNNLLALLTIAQKRKLLSQCLIWLINSWATHHPDEDTIIPPPEAIPSTVLLYTIGINPPGPVVNNQFNVRLGDFEDPNIVLTIGLPFTQGYTLKNWYGYPNTLIATAGMFPPDNTIMIAK